MYPKASKMLWIHHEKKKMCSRSCSWLLDSSCLLLVPFQYNNKKNPLKVTQDILQMMAPSRSELQSCSHTHSKTMSYFRDWWKVFNTKSEWSLDTYKFSLKWDGANKFLPLQWSEQILTRLSLYVLINGLSLHCAAAEMVTDSLSITCRHAAMITANVCLRLSRLNTMQSHSSCCLFLEKSFFKFNSNLKINRLFCVCLLLNIQYLLCLFPLHINLKMWSKNTNVLPASNRTPLAASSFHHSSARGLWCFSCLFSHFYISLQVFNTYSVGVRMREVGGVIEALLVRTKISAMFPPGISPLLPGNNLLKNSIFVQCHKDTEQWCKCNGQSHKFWWPLLILFTKIKVQYHNYRSNSSSWNKKKKTVSHFEPEGRNWLKFLSSYQPLMFSFTCGFSILLLPRWNYLLKATTEKTDGH